MESLGRDYEACCALTTSVAFILILPFISRGAYIGGPNLLSRHIVCFVPRAPAMFFPLVSYISLRVLAFPQGIFQRRATL